MIDVASDFPFVAELPKREKSRLVRVWDSLREFSASLEGKGLPVPFKTAAALLEVSVQRVDELATDGALERVEFMGHRYVTENSLVAHCRTERKRGRPQKVIDDCGTSYAAAWKLSRSVVRKEK